MDEGGCGLHELALETLFARALASWANNFFVSTTRVARLAVALLAGSVTDRAVDGFGPVTSFTCHKFCSGSAVSLCGAAERGCQKETCFASQNFAVVNRATMFQQCSPIEKEARSPPGRRIAQTKTSPFGH